MAVFLFICCMHIDQISADRLISYYDDIQFRGEEYTRNLRPGLCVDFTSFNKRISSINTHGNCVQIFEDYGCQGDYRTLSPGSQGHNNLGHAGFNDRTSSMQLC